MQRDSSTGPASVPAPVGEADHVSKSFGETRALVDVSLNVLPGECHGLVGRNGAGKSTLVSLLTGLSRPDHGSVRLAGQAAPGLADRGGWLERVACVYQRQVVEIARALSIGARFLILDEPTSSLEKAAVERLFERVRRLREGGVGVLYISHHLEEIYDICDRVSVLRDGGQVLSGRVKDITQGDL